MNEIKLKQKIARNKRVLLSFEVMPVVAIIIVIGFLRLDPFCANVHGDHMGCGFATLFLGVGLGVLLLLAAMIGMVICSVMIRKHASLLAQVTNTNYEPSRFSVMLMLTLFILFFALTMAILMPLFSSALETETWWVILAITLSGVSGITFSTSIAYLLRT